MFYSGWMFLFLGGGDGVLYLKADFIVQYIVFLIAKLFRI